MPKEQRKDKNEVKRESENERTKGNVLDVETDRFNEGTCQYNRKFRCHRRHRHRHRRHHRRCFLAEGEIHFA